MTVGARKDLAYNSVKLVSLADWNRYELDSNTGKAFYPFKVMACPYFGHL
jgi:hypothetical protein